MNLFKKKKSKNTNVTVNNSSNAKITRTDELKVEITHRNYVIFSDSTSKYLCLDNDFDNLITFWNYEKLIQGTLILRKGDVWALLYFNNASEKFELTDFVFTTIKEEKHSLLLTTHDNKKYLYCYYAIYNDICDYVAYDFEDDFNLVLIKFHDHDELYRRYFSIRLDLLFSAKSIESCTIFNENITSFWKALFKYTSDDSKFVNYFIIDSGHLSDGIKNENSYVSLNLVNYLKDSAAIIGANEHGKKCIFDMYSPNKISKYYDDIQNSGKLFLCIDGNHIEIIDISFNVYYENDFIDTKNISLFYNEEADIYILSNNDSKILSLHLYNIYCENFYSIFKVDEEYGTLCNFEPQFCIPNFIKICEYDIFEFKDEYLKKISCCYAFFKKDAILKNRSDFYFNSEYLKNGLFYNETEEDTFYLDSNHISILQKCDIDDIYGIRISDDNSMIIKAYNSICDITILEDLIKIKVITGENMELNVSDIKTNLIDYIFEHITNKFSIAYLKYKLK